MRNNLSYFIPGGGSLSLGHSLTRSRELGEAVPELGAGVTVIDVPQSEHGVVLKRGEPPLPKSGARGQFRVDVDEGYVVNRLVISPDGTYGAMVRRRDEWLGTTSVRAPLGTRVTGVMVSAVDDE